jgi:AraC family transcriptional regulator of arabinose operon
MDARIQQVVAIIEREPHQKFSLVSMGKVVGLSPSRLRHKFKSEMGITPRLYLQNIRMRMAAELLKNEDLSIKEVRAAVGLESDSYFTHLCKRVYGESPSRIRHS